eukprot:13981334-Alexandrium_andersonii.AAC.1
MSEDNEGAKSGSDLAPPKTHLWSSAAIRNQREGAWEHARDVWRRQRGRASAVSYTHLRAHETSAHL